MFDYSALLLNACFWGYVALSVYVLISARWTLLIAYFLLDIGLAIALLKSPTFNDPRNTEGGVLFALILAGAFLIVVLRGLWLLLIRLNPPPPPPT